MKPSFFQNEDLAACGPLAMLLFEGLWCHADRDGRLEDRPARLKIQVLPYFDADCNALLDALKNAGFIERYEVDGRKYIQVLNFVKHQNPHVKESASTIPAPGQHHASTGNTGTSPADSLLLIPLTLNPPKPSCGEPDGSPPFITLTANDGSEIPITDSQCEEWGTLFPAVDVPQELRNMRAWLIANPRNRKTAGGMTRFATSWLSRAQNAARKQPPKLSTMFEGAV